MPLPLKILFTDFSVADTVAAGFWMNNMQDVEMLLVHVVPQFVPGAHNVTFPLVMETVAKELALVPSPFVNKKVTPARSDVTVA